MTNRPVYRNRPPSGGGWGILLPAFLLFLAGFWPFIFWHGCKYSDGSGLSVCGSGSDWTWTGQTWAACGIWWGICVLPFAVVLVSSAARKRAARPPKGRLKVEATPQSAIPVRWPPCPHRNAVRVGAAADPAVTLENWCPDCEENLGPAYKRHCCGAPPGDIPGSGHLYNCKHAVKGKHHDPRQLRAARPSRRCRTCPDCLRDGSDSTARPRSLPLRSRTPQGP